MASQPPPTRPGVSLRPPTLRSPSSSSTQVCNPPPSPLWLAGTWHVTHSTLPLWRNKRNVHITYSILPDNRIEDNTSYQTLSSRKLHQVLGVNRPASKGGGGAYDWQGKGWLWIARSHWEILGWGDVELADGDDANTELMDPRNGGEEGRGAWAVTYFAKTLFTPAGIDIYSRRKEGLPRETLEDILKGLRAIEVVEVKKLVEGIFELKQDRAGEVEAKV